MDFGWSWLFPRAATWYVRLATCATGRASVIVFTHALRTKDGWRGPCKGFYVPFNSDASVSGRPSKTETGGVPKNVCLLSGTVACCRP
jgi:hypothetical protein